MKKKGLLSMRECGPNIYFTVILWPPMNGFLAIPDIRGRPGTEATLLPRKSVITRTLVATAAGIPLAENATHAPGYMNIIVLFVPCLQPFIYYTYIIMIVYRYTTCIIIITLLLYTLLFINPRRACAARVIVLGLSVVCLLLFSHYRPRGGL